MPLDFEFLARELSTQPNFQKPRCLFGGQMDPPIQSLSSLVSGQIDLPLHELHFSCSKVMKRWLQYALGGLAVLLAAAA
jgi:hypothetical protein